MVRIKQVVRDEVFDEELLLDDLPGSVSSSHIKRARESILRDIDEDDLLENMSPEEAAFMIGTKLAQAGDEYDV